ncbi:hypothetical protein [Sphingorhabdus sp.]|uniref:hypothetical protein n=1 Tax=Sphingorhabdus sp. TaxID=1902408 RepID=UPI0037CA5473
MGEAKQKSRAKAEILESEGQCVYCYAEPTTVEHMPPKSMFRNKIRLSGLEFACCENCNHSTSASDAAASFFARLSPTHQTDQNELDEAHSLVDTLAQRAPGAILEIFNEQKSKRIWAKGRSSIYGQMHAIKLDGPVTHSLITAFTAKFGMAMFREHVGRPMNRGGVYTQFYFNAGLSREIATATVDFLPFFGQLTMGKQRSGKQFNYRFNSDLKSITATFAAFRDNLFVRAIAVEEPESYRFLSEEYNADFVPFAGLPELARIWTAPLPKSLKIS